MEEIDTRTASRRLLACNRTALVAAFVVYAGAIGVGLALLMVSSLAGEGPKLYYLVRDAGVVGAALGAAVGLVANLRNGLRSIAADARRSAGPLALAWMGWVLFASLGPVVVASWSHKPSLGLLLWPLALMLVISGVLYALLGVLIERRSSG